MKINNPRQTKDELKRSLLSLQKKKSFDKRFDRWLKIQKGEPIDLDLEDTLNLLAFGKTDVIL